MINGSRVNLGEGRDTMPNRLLRQLVLPQDVSAIASIQLSFIRPPNKLIWADTGVYTVRGT